MVKRRIIPKLLIKRQKIGQLEVPMLVTTRRFSSPRRVGAPVSQARIYEAQMADELIVLNLDRDPVAADSPMMEIIRELASETFMPLTVGGGVRRLADFEVLLANGADKVAITTAALEDPGLIDTAARTFGAQCVVVGIDVAGGRVMTEAGARDAARDPLDWARQAVGRGAGEIMLNDIDRDGGGGGLNLALGRAIADAVAVPLVLSGGAGLARHFVEGFAEARAEGVAAGTFFAAKDQNPMQARSHVANAGIPIRMIT